MRSGGHKRYLYHLASTIALLASMILLAKFRGSKFIVFSNEFLGILGGLGTFAALVSALRRRGEKPLAMSRPEHIARAQEMLAMQVQADWNRELGAADLREPMPTYWSLIPPPLADPATRAVRTAPPIRPTNAESIAGLVRCFRRLGSQLVILGDPGMGKTTLAELMLAELAKQLPERPGQKEPVPVLMSLASWEASPHEDFCAWMARQLKRNYQSLGVVADYGPTAHKSLVTAGRILPVLDGLDEVAEEARPGLLEAIDIEWGDRPLIITCRSAEYAAADQALTHDVLVGAARIEAQPLTPGGAADFLAGCLERQRPHPAWDGVTEDLRNGTAPLWPALNTPLVLWLVSQERYSKPHVIEKKKRPRAASNASW